MPADIVNLRRARKAKARADKEREATAKRALFGRTKAEKARQAAERSQATRALESHRRERE
jgi:hypothetical protein